jgi:hypothetical protein
MYVVDENKMEKEVSKDEPTPCSMPNEGKMKLIEKVKINVPAEESETYMRPLLKHHNVFSLDKNDISLATNLNHRIDLKNKEPTYKK